jgi:hypothetical protein
VEDSEILSTVQRLVMQEHELREQGARGAAEAGPDRARLAEIDESLDQCWDLLRQRRALREFDQDAETAAVRPVSQVEGYLQ